MSKPAELISTRVPPEIAEMLKRQAETERRPLSQYVRNLLTDAVTASPEVRV
jgi:predicted HicB family RNase H-like nuclease